MKITRTPEQIKREQDIRDKANKGCHFADANSEKRYPGTLTYRIDSMDVFGDENALVGEGWQKVDTLQALTEDAIFKMTVEDT